MRLSRYTVMLRLSRDEYMLFHGISGAVDIVDDEIADGIIRVATGESPEKAFDEEQIKTLLKRGYLTEKSHEEEREKARGMILAMHRGHLKKSPGFLIVPSYRCNLRCPYCYEGRRYLWRQDRIMDRETADMAFEAMLKLIEGRRYPRNHILFYGGEPFLEEHTDIVAYIIEKGTKLGFTFGAVTNGTNVDKFLPLFGGPGRFVFFQITLDGPPEVHDRRRKYADGKGSFDRIAHNISLLLQEGYRVSLRMNVDRSNIDQAGRMMDLVEGMGWRRYHTFTAYFAPVHREGGRPCIEEPFFSYRLIKALGDRYAYMGETRGGVFRTFDRVFKVGRRVEFSTTICGATGTQYILDPYGDIYTCWDAVGIQEEKVGVYLPKLQLNEMHDRWAWRTVAMIDECMDCPYLLVCRGGCPHYAFERTGRLESPFCNSFSAFFEHQVKMAYKLYARDLERRIGSAERGLALPNLSPHLPSEPGWTKEAKKGGGESAITFEAPREAKRTRLIGVSA